MKKIILIMAVVMTIALFSGSIIFAGDKQYIVKKGDTLSEIAWFLKIPREKIVEWNPETGIRSIYPGQKLRYCIFPDAMDIINQVHEAIGTVIPIVQESNDEIKKIVRENHDGLTLQIGQVQAKQNTGAEAKTSKQDRIGIMVVIIVVVFLALVFVVFTVRKKGRKSKNEVEIHIHGKKYIYRPQRDLDGRYVSLYLKGRDFLAFKKIADLGDSVRSSLNKDPVLMEQEIEEGRLILIK